jgi:hypothetical protein
LRKWQLVGTTGIEIARSVAAGRLRKALATSLRMINASDSKPIPAMPHTARVKPDVHLRTTTPAKINALCLVKISKHCLSIN